MSSFLARSFPKTGAAILLTLFILLCGCGETASPAEFRDEVDGFRYEVRDVSVTPRTDDTFVIANITNVGRDMFMYTRYNIDFFDENGRVIASAGPVRVSADLHPSGVTLPIWFFVDQLSDWSRYEIYVSDRGYGTEGIDAQLLNLTIEPEGSDSEPCVSYRVTNHSNKIASWVRVIGRIYDGEGNLESAWAGGLSRQFLGPGDTSDLMPCVSESYPFDLQVIGYHQPNLHTED